MKLARAVRTESLSKAVSVAAILAVAAFATFVIYNESPEREAETIEAPLAGLISKLERGDVTQKRGAMQGLELRNHTAIEFPQALQALIRALDDDSEEIRIAATASIGNLIDIRSIGASRTHEPPPLVVSIAPEAEQTLAPLLDDPSTKIRLAAARSLEQVAAGARLATPPPGLLEHYQSDEDDAVRIAVANALVEYGEGPERLLPVVLARFKSDPQAVREAGAIAIERVRLLPSAVPLLIEGLSSDDARICLMCATSLEHIGPPAAPAVPALLNLIRKEVKTPHMVREYLSGVLLGMAMRAVARIRPADGPLADEAGHVIGGVLKR